MIQSWADEWLPACLLSDSRFPFKDSQQETVTSLRRQLYSASTWNSWGSEWKHCRISHRSGVADTLWFRNWKDMLVLPVVLDHCLWQWPQSPADDEILCTYVENGPTCMPLDRLNWAYAEKIVTSIPCMETECWDLQLALKLIFWMRMFELFESHKRNIFWLCFFLAYCPPTAPSWLTLVRRRVSLACAYDNLDAWYSRVMLAGEQEYEEGAVVCWNTGIIARLLEKWVHLASLPYTPALSHVSFQLHNPKTRCCILTLDHLVSGTISQITFFILLITHSAMATQVRFKKKHLSLKVH